MSLEEESLILHKKLKGKISIEAQARIKNARDLSLLYTPGVAEPCRAIAKGEASVYELTIKNNSVAIVTDGSRVLGLGDIGPEAALPVMEGKALIMKELAGINAFPICLRTKEADGIIETIKNIEPVFGAINLEDIETPKVFYIEERLTNELGIPVFHDDQHGTAIVVLAGLINALKITGREKNGLNVAVNGAGSAGYAISMLLRDYGIGKITVFDREGAIYSGRAGLGEYKRRIAEETNADIYKGRLDGFQNADVIISAAAPGSLPHGTILKMRHPKIVFALANPVPELSLEEAEKLGIAVFGTGRSDYPNQLNNSVCFPGFLRALLDLRIRKITKKMKISAAEAIASLVSRKELKKGRIIPDTFDKRLVKGIMDKIKRMD